MNARHRCHARPFGHRQEGGDGHRPGSAADKERRNIAQLHRREHRHHTGLCHRPDLRRLSRKDVHSTNHRPHAQVRDCIRTNPTGRFYVVKAESNKDGTRSVKLGGGMFKEFAPRSDNDWTIPYNVAEICQGLARYAGGEELEAGEYGIWSQGEIDLQAGFSDVSERGAVRLRRGLMVCGVLVAQRRWARDGFYCCDRSLTLRQ